MRQCEFAGCERQHSDARTSTAMAFAGGGKPVAAGTFALPPPASTGVAANPFASSAAPALVLNAAGVIGTVKEADSDKVHVTCIFVSCCCLQSRLRLCKTSLFTRSDACCIVR